MRGQKKEKAGDIKDAAVQRRPGYRRVLLCLILAAVALFFFGRWLTSEELEVTFQHLYSSKIAGGENIRVVVLSDLHNREFGPSAGNWWKSPLSIIALAITRAI